MYPKFLIILLPLSVKPLSKPPVLSVLPYPEPLTINWKPLRKYNDERDNAGIIIKCSNVCPFKRSNRGIYECFYCLHTAVDFGPFRKHVADHPNRLETLRLKQNSIVKVDISDLKCELCRQDIKDLPKLVDHLIEVHNQPLKKNIGFGVIPFLLGQDRFKCAICALTFNLFIDLNRHLNDHYPNNVCSLCGKPFTNVINLKAHLLTHEKKTQVRCKCTKCGEVFKSYGDKIKHMAVEHGDYYHKCPYCNESFKTYTRRVKHLEAFHDKKVEYRCSMCPAVFLMCHNRTKHIRQVHIRDKKFACDVCGARFVRSGDLKRHMIKHDGERKFQCQVCKKAYARKKTLTEHMRIHNNDRRYVCAHCNSAFVQKCALKGHMKTHHPAAVLTSVKL